MKNLIGALVLLFSTSLVSSAQTNNRISYNDQHLWLNGGNVAWVNFARDIGPGETRMDAFKAMYSNVKEHGGNAMRLWLHTTGAVSPEFDGFEVVGPGDGTIEDLRVILDEAWNNDIGLILCLWSFDMLRARNGELITDRAKALLESSVLTQRYIDNALIPMVKELGDHPAIIAWEIFNEAEGMSDEFGWEFNRHVPMADIQRFVNQTTGAIHRTNPNALVSNGAWSFRVLWDGAKHPYAKNYYSDEELVSAGGDSLGTLDFYMVHYYPWAGTELSPFHHPKEYWELDDKDLVVAEFEVPSDSLFGIPGKELYQKLYDTGYAGALVWQWVDWYSKRTNGGHAQSWLNALPLMKEMTDKYPEDINIKN